MDQAVIDRLTKSVGTETDAGDAMMTVLATVADQLRKSANDPVAVNALADTLDAKAAAWTAATLANTPAAAQAPPVSEPPATPVV